MLCLQADRKNIMQTHFLGMVKQELRDSVIVAPSARNSFLQSLSLSKIYVDAKREGSMKVYVLTSPGLFNTLKWIALPRYCVVK